jgi:polyvinyl alcohol dehydrogenase (cytochrome)
MRRYATIVSLPVLLTAIACSGSSSGAAGATPHSPTSTGATGSSAATGATAAPAAKARYANWPMYHGGPAKRGHVKSGLKLPLHHAWTKKLNGSVWSEPVIADGTLIAATEHDSVYGLNPTNGNRRWRVNLGTPEPLSEQPCGDIDPIGITSSPAFDKATGSVFVVATTGDGKHTLWALNAKTGHKRWHRNVDVDKSRDRNAEQQRAALLVIHKRVIVTYGAHAGDCGNYVGYAASVATSGKGKIPFYAVPNARQAGMWGPAGPVEAIDGNILTPTANGSNRTGGKWDHSDGVIELTPKMHYVRGWAPANWEQGDADDLSLGSTSPVRVAGKYIVGGKRGEVWLLKAHLGGVNGQLDTLGSDNFCNAFGGIAVAGHVAILPCKNFNRAHSVRAITVGKKSLHTKWQANGIYGSPIIAGKRVYVADLESGDLKVLALKTGHVIASIPVGSLPTFPSEVVDGNHVFVPTLTGITAIRGS